MNRDPRIPDSAIQITECELSPLAQLCLQAAASSSVWRQQRRLLECLPEHAANALLALLLCRKLVAAPQLELFHHSVTRIHLAGGAVTREALSYISEFLHLEVLSLTRATKLRDADLLATLLLPPPAATSDGDDGAGLSRTLRSLSLVGCSGLTTRTCIALRHLSALRCLDLSDTGMRPPIVAHLTALTALTHLDLGGLGTGDEDCAAMRSCGETGGDGSSVVGSSGAGLRQLCELEVWSGVGWSERGLSHLATLPSLTALNVGWSDLRLLPVLPTLQVLRMFSCEVHDVWWPPMSDPPTGAAAGASAAPLVSRMRELYLGRADLTAALPAVQQVLRMWSSTLVVLDLSGTCTSDCGFLQPCSPHLTRLDLSGAAVTDDAVWQVAAAATQLRALALGGTRVGVAAVAALVGLPALEVLDMSSTDLADDGLSWLQQLTSLQDLNLHNCALSGESGGAEGGGWGGMGKLRRLNMLGTKLTDKGLLGLRALRVAELHLTLGSKHITDKGLTAVPAISGLANLTLQACSITQHGVQQLSRAVTLQQLDIQGCWMVTRASLEELMADSNELQLVTLDGAVLPGPSGPVSAPVAPKSHGRDVVASAHRLAGAHLGAMGYDKATLLALRPAAASQAVVEALKGQLMDGGLQELLP